jgi:hypothetical protein
VRRAISCWKDSSIVEWDVVPEAVIAYEAICN